MSIPFCFNFYYCGCVLRALYTDSTHNTQHTPIIHRSTYPNPSPHPHTQTQTQPSNKVTHKHNPATKPSHTHKHKPIQKSGHRSKTQARPPIHTADQPIHAANLKPRPPIKNWSKPIQKKSSPEQTHSKNIITRATGANPFKKIITGATEQTHSIKSSPKPSEQIHSKK